MTDRARILGLMALREQARGAGLLARVAGLTRKLAEGDALIARLQAMMAQRRAAPALVRLVGALQSDHHLTAQLLAELDRQRALRDEVARDLLAARADLARQDHRRDTFAARAQEARRSAREQRQALADAALPQRRPPQ